MAKHSEGTWRVSFGDGYADIYGGDGHGRIARVFLRESKTNNVEELAANAALIATTPELLGMLIAIVAQNDACEMHLVNWETARERIAKATT